MTTTGGAPKLYVLKLVAVREGIDRLQGQRIHEHFPAYLHVRQQAITAGSFTDIQPVWNEVGELLRMPGGPPTKPHYRPFASRTVRDPSRYWLNDNLPGSYAPMSLRTTARFMLDESSRFALPPDHAQQALAILLRGSKVPAWALAAYYMRNYGFAFDGVGGYDDLIAAFKQEFLFDHDDDFDVLFEDEEPVSFTDEWFEPFIPAEQVTRDG